MNQSTLSPMKEPPHSPIPDQIKTPKCSFVKTEQKMFWWLWKKNSWGEIIFTLRRPEHVKTT